MMSEVEDVQISMQHIANLFVRFSVVGSPEFLFADRGAEQPARRQPDGGRLHPVVPSRNILGFFIIMNGLVEKRLVLVLNMFLFVIIYSLSFSLSSVCFVVFRRNMKYCRRNRKRLLIFPEKHCCCRVS